MDSDGCITGWIEKRAGEYERLRKHTVDTSLYNPNRTRFIYILFWILREFPTQSMHKEASTRKVYCHRLLSKFAKALFTWE